MNTTNKILLMGNPNVGKSVFFTALTGINAVSSNYAGTTVTYLEGNLRLNGDNSNNNPNNNSNNNLKYTLIDVPGTYSLNPTSQAEEVAVSFVENGADAIICVLDASNLERNLHLALELRAYDIPVIYALNLVDVAIRRGIDIKVKLLARELGAPVISTVAVKNQGIDELKHELTKVLEPETNASNAEQFSTSCQSCNNCNACPSKSDCDLWNTAKEISRRVSRNDSERQNFLDKLGDDMMKPFPGIPIAIVVVALLIGFVVGIGETLRGFVLEPLVEDIIVPFFERLFSSFIPEGMFLNILVGEYGIFVISFEWILATILPYVFLFYVSFSFLEDSGYLPRISVLFDNIMRKLGVQGGSLIYTIMGMGCAVPAIIGTRASTSHKERIIITAAVCFAIPCVSQTGAIVTLLSAYSWWLMPAMMLLAMLTFAAAATVTGKLTKGHVDPLLIEIPNLLLPEPKAYLRKLGIRMKHFLAEAELPMMIAIAIAALLKETGALDSMAEGASPLVSGWLGLPSEAVTGLLLGAIRREMSIAPLLALDLTPLQAFIGGAVSLLYLPCLSVFGVLVKEFKLRVALTISVLTMVNALLMGGIINHVGRIFNA